MDLAENNAILTHSAVSDNNSYMVDTEAPRVDNFTLSDTALKIGDNATVNLEFSEAVIEFIAADITNPNGSLPSMTSSDNITWTGTFTPTANREVASNSFSLGSSSYTDLAGNAGPLATTANYEVETMGSYCEQCGNNQRYGYAEQFSECFRCRRWRRVNIVSHFQRVGHH